MDLYSYFFSNCEDSRNNYCTLSSDKGNYVVLMKSSILGKSDSPNELVSLACTFTA